MEKTYGTPFKYGINGYIGSNMVLKMRANASLFEEEILPFLKKQNIHHTFHFNNNKVVGKYGERCVRYAHFTCFVSVSQLNQIKILGRKRKILALQEEIVQLSMF